MAKFRSAVLPKGARERRTVLLGDGEQFGVFDSNKVYSQHAVARILGLAGSFGECNKFVLRNLLHQGLPFAKVGRQYLISGRLLHAWVEERSKVWEEHQAEKLAIKSNLGL